MLSSFLFLFFFFNDTATTEIYTLSLHDALPIYIAQALHRPLPSPVVEKTKHHLLDTIAAMLRSEEHTSELQSRLHLVCRLLLEKKKKKNIHQLSAIYNMTSIVRSKLTIAKTTRT